MKFFSWNFLDFLNNQERKIPIIAYVSVIGGFLVHISLGGVYTYGSMFPHILNYMSRNNTMMDSGDAKDTIWILGLAIFGRGASMTVGGFIERQMSATITILLGGCIMTIGYLSTYFSIRVHIIAVAITYGLIVGLGTGIAYGVAMTIPSEWFPKNRGLLSGIVLAGFGIGSLGFDLVQANIINDGGHNLNAPDSSKVPISFIIMGSIYFFIQMIGAPMIKRPIQEHEENTSQMEFNLLSFLRDSKEVNFRPHQLIFVPQFWIIWIAYSLNSVVSILFLTLHKSWGKILKISDTKILIATSVGGLFSIFGRIIWGYLIDKVGYKILIFGISLATSIMFITFYLCSSIGNDKKPDESSRFVMYLIWVIILFFLTSANFTLFPQVCVKAFGSKNYTGNFGVLFTGYSFGGIVTSILITKSFQSTQASDFLSPFLVGSVMSILSLLVSIFYRNRADNVSINMLTMFT